MPTTKRNKRALTEEEAAEVRRLLKAKGVSHASARSYSWREGITYRVVHHPIIGVFICGADVWEKGESADPKNVVLATYEP